MIQLNNLLRLGAQQLEVQLMRVDEAGEPVGVVVCLCLVCCGTL